MPLSAKRRLEFMLASFALNNFILPLIQGTQEDKDPSAIYFLLKSLEHDELFIDEFQAWLKTTECPPTLITLMAHFLSGAAPQTWASTSTQFDLSAYLTSINPTKD